MQRAAAARGQQGSSGTAAAAQPWRRKQREGAKDPEGPTGRVAMPDLLEEGRAGKEGVWEAEKGFNVRCVFH